VEGKRLEPRMDRVWKLKAKHMAEKDFVSAATQVVAGYAGVKLNAEREAEDCLSFFFKLPKSEAKSADIVELELSIYDLGGGKLVLSQEPDACENNQYWDEISQLAEDLAEELGGEGVTL
jgi:hypothetical protein